MAPPCFGDMPVLVYIRGVGIPIKHIGFILLLVLGVYVSYNVFYQYTENSNIEFYAEEETNLNSLGSHHDHFDEDQFSFQEELEQTIVLAREQGFSTVGCRENHPFFTIWHPPKIN